MRETIYSTRGKKGIRIRGDVRKRTNVSTFNNCVHLIIEACVFIFYFIFFKKQILIQLALCGLMIHQREGLWEEAAGLGTARGH